MKFEEVINVFRTGEIKSIKKCLPEIEKDNALKSELLDYYSDILHHTKGKVLPDILKISKNLLTKKIRTKEWNPNANSIEILSHLSLDYLSLWDDECIPGWIKHTNFRSLSFVKHAEKDFVYPISVYEFELRDCGLKQIPEIIREINPRRLSFTENNIETIPDWVFETVERLDVSRNCIQKIELKNSNSIDTLRLNHNKISDLTFLHHFPQLDFLVLEDNPVSNFPKLDDSPLKQLFMNNCNFTEIPDTLNALKKLTVLYLDNNPIARVPELDLPHLGSLGLIGTPIGIKHNIEDTLSGNEAQSFLKRNHTVDNGFLEICKLLESSDPNKIEAAYDLLRSNEDDLKKAEKRYLKFIHGRLGLSATIFDFEKAMFSQSEAEAVCKAINRDSYSFSLAYSDDYTSKLIVDFLGSIVESAIDFDGLRKQLSACSSEEELISLGQEKLYEIKNAIFDFTLTYKEGWFGKLLNEFTSIQYRYLTFDHTHFDIANTSDYIEAFFVFLQCFSYDDYYIDIFQSDSPRLGEIFWLLPIVPKVIWSDVKPEYPMSPLCFKRYATLNENNKGKRMKSELIAEINA